MKRVLLIATTFVFLALSGNRSIQVTAMENATAAIDGPAPAFTLQDLNGRTHSLADYRGRIAVVTFLSAKCPVSNDYNSRIQAVTKAYGDRGIAFLAINANSDEPGKLIRTHSKSNGFSFPILKDVTGKVANAYGAVRTPEVYIVDAKGLLRYHGRIDNSRNLAGVRRRDLNEALDELLAGKAVSVPETKAFGCPIVRSKAAVSPITAGKAGSLGKVELLKPAGFTKLLEEGRGKVLLINFWATWCSPCVAEFPEFVAFDEKYRAKGLRVVGISADEVSDLESKVVPFVTEMKVRFDIFVQDVEDPQIMIDLIDKKWEGALPATFIYDRQGKLTFVRYGIIDRGDVTLAIEAALKK
ncbi:MAG: redoxin domain-containing protein [Acidobacteriota bacterium]